MRISMCVNMNVGVVEDSAARLTRVFLCVRVIANANANLNLNGRECECVCAFGTVLVGLIRGAPSGAHLEELGTTFLTALLHESHGAPCKRVS